MKSSCCLTHVNIKIMSGSEIRCTQSSYAGANFAGSGTTLVEQILASHPDVFGAGELRDIRSIVGTISKYDKNQSSFPDYIRTIDGKVLKGFAEAYLKRIRSLHSSSLRVVDKMPQNFLFLGLIAIMFPNASVVHCRRNPLDTCLSCYFQRFRMRQEYSFDLAHLGNYYRYYQDLMDHWRETLPIRIFDISYEDIVSDPEPQCRALLEYCGLNWDDRCLSFHKTQRPLTTASNLQVRQPLYNSSVERWRRYESHLGPLVAALKGE